MGINECSQLASKSSWDSQDFGDVNMVLKMVHFHKSSRPQWVKCVIFKHSNFIDILCKIATGPHWWLVKIGSSSVAWCHQGPISM